MGGPRHAEVLEHLAGLPRGISVGEAFTRAPLALRRPVELLAYLELADLEPAHADDGAGPGDVPPDRLERVTAVRADGTERRFVLPRVPVRDEGGATATAAGTTTAKEGQ
jgi:hypothetical protein